MWRRIGYFDSISPQKKNSERMQTGVIGAGAMGSGIAQIAAQSGCEVWITDTRQEALDKSRASLTATLTTLCEKGKITEEEKTTTLSRLHFTQSMSDLKHCELVIEAIVEDLAIKQQVFRSIEEVVSETCVLATNTSSLSVTSIASACRVPERVLGLHFFNPAPLMPLVEIIPALQTRSGLADELRALMAGWKKVSVVCRDLPGFIVNRVARPYYSEALRILDEGAADMAAIDEAMRRIGFRMGPFELMDLIGHDVNYTVTETVFRSFYFDPRYRPSITQKRLVEAGWLGRKSGRGFYSYAKDTERAAPSMDEELLRSIANRILTMLINEAYDALYLGVASREDLDLAMIKGVNYPKGLISWGIEIGLNTIRERMDALYQKYREDRYRTSPGLY